MKNFLFFTDDGFTYDINHKEIMNLQILGTAEGENLVEAFNCFKINQSYLKDYSFKNIIALEYVDNFIRNLKL